MKKGGVGTLSDWWNKMNKLIDWKNRLKDRHMLTLIVTLVLIITALGLYFITDAITLSTAEVLNSLSSAS